MEQRVMPWFQNVCRNLGLAVHHVTHPQGEAAKTTVQKTVEQEQVSDTVTLRRTTIEEVEIHPPTRSSKTPK